MIEMNQEQMMDLLDDLYAQCVNGIKKVSPSIEDLADDYLNKNSNIEEAAKSFINFQIAKCTTTGFITSLGGLITLPIAIPADVGSVLYVQMRMIATLAYMGGFDVDCDQVKTLIYACLAGVALDNIFKKAGINFGNKIAVAMIKKIPVNVVRLINKKVGMRLLTKFGEKGIVNLGKAVPIVGGIIGGGVDFAETKFIANRSYKMFILQDPSSFHVKEKNNKNLVVAEQ